MTFGDPRLPDRFWDKVITEPNSGCWIWLAATDKKGYGFFWYQGAKRWAHRLVKTFTQTAHHKCFNSGCVNPDHLIDVSREVNSGFGHAKWPYVDYTNGDTSVPF